MGRDVVRSTILYNLRVGGSRGHWVGAEPYRAGQVAWGIIYPEDRREVNLSSGEHRLLTEWVR